MPFDQVLPKLYGLVLWLIPSEPYTSFYRKEIERLSVRFNTTSFTPHLTLGRLRNGSADLKFEFLPPLLSKLDNNVSAVHAHIECRPSPYQNLIHALNSGHNLDQLQSELKTRIPEYQTKKEYHVSLLYGDISCNALNEEIADLSTRSPEQVTFSKLRVTELNGQPDSWRTLQELKF